MPVRTRVRSRVGDIAGSTGKRPGSLPAGPGPHRRLNAAIRRRRTQPRRTARSVGTGTFPGERAMTGPIRLAALATLCAALAACSPVQARPLVDVAVIDRERGNWLE